jgi:RNA polymerase sigma-70 factor, ECF subfamily
VERTDAQLACDAGRGDSAAFGVLVERYRATLVGYVAGVLGSRDDAEELAQEAFLRAWRQAPTLREPAKVGGWLHQIARNLAMSHVRKPRLARKPKLVPLGADPPGRPATGDDERWPAVLAAVGRLSGPHREVIAKRHFAGCQNEEIAVQLGVPPGTIRSRLARAYAELREMLREEGSRDLGI